jgi:hypothetical protein
MRSIRLAVPLLVVLAVTVPTASATSSPRAGAAAAPVHADFNGDGFSDIAIGAPFEKVGAISGAGAVHVLYGTADGATTTASTRLILESAGFQPAETADSGFGWSLAAGDFDGDGFADLAVGAPFMPVESMDHAGRAVTFLGSNQGLTNDTGLSFDERDFEEVEEPDEFYGTALASGDFNDDGLADLAVGGPNESVDGVTAAGTVGVLFGDDEGLGAGDLATRRFNAESVGGGAFEDHANFGAALAAGSLGQGPADDLAIGAPNDADGSHLSGSVTVVYGSGEGPSGDDGHLLHESGAPGAIVRGGDEFGSALAIGNVVGTATGDLAVGAPQERIGDIPNAGGVFVYPGGATGVVPTSVKRFSAATSGVAGNPANGGLFGQSLAIDNLGKTALPDLAIDAPGRPLPTGSGAVYVLFHGGNGITGTGSLALTHSTPGVPGSPSSLGWGSATIATGNIGHGAVRDLVVAAKSEVIAGQGCGAVYALYGRANGPTGADSQRFTLNSPAVAGACTVGNATAFGQSLG